MKMILATIEAKPVLGVLAGYGSFLTGLLTWIGVISPIVGFIGVCFGTFAAYHAWKINKRKDRQEEAAQKESEAERS